MTVEQALEKWSPVDLAIWISRGLIDTTPLGFTAAGWRRLRSARPRKPDGAPVSTRDEGAGIAAGEAPGAPVGSQAVLGGDGR